MGNARSELAQLRARHSVAWAADGMSTREIAQRLGVSTNSVEDYLRKAGRAPRAGDRAAIDRLLNQAVGLAMAADMIPGTVITPEPDETARWLGDLTKTIRALSQLRTRIRNGASE